MRFDPEHELAEHLEYCGWKPARFPAGPRTRRLRRRLGRMIDAAVRGAYALARGLTVVADLVHGQPQVSTRVDWGRQPPAAINRYVERKVPLTRTPDAPEDIAYLAQHAKRDPVILDHVGAETLEAVLLAMRGQE